MEERVTRGIRRCKWLGPPFATYSGRGAASQTQVSYNHNNNNNNNENNYDYYDYYCYYYDDYYYDYYYYDYYYDHD